jgi:hypothetical protein
MILGQYTYIRSYYAPNHPKTSQIVRKMAIQTTAKNLTEILRLREKVVKAIEEMRSSQECPSPLDPVKGESKKGF